MDERRDIFITTSWDDGSFLDLKLAESLKKYGIPATFYFPINCAERTLSLEQMRDIGKNFDIGCHSYSHPILTKLDEESIFREIRYAKEALESIVGKEVKVFCYPKGIYNKEIIEAVKKAGFIAARTVRVLEYRVDLNSPFEIGTTIHAPVGGFTQIKRFFISSRVFSNIRLPLYLLYKRAVIGNWLKLAMEALNFIKRNGGIFHLWGHSSVIDKYNEWSNLEKLFKCISTLNGRNIFKVDNTTLCQILFQRD